MILKAKKNKVLENVTFGVADATNLCYERAFIEPYKRQNRHDVCEVHGFKREIKTGNLPCGKLPVVAFSQFPLTLNPCCNVHWTLCFHSNTGN